VCVHPAVSGSTTKAHVQLRQCASGFVSLQCLQHSCVPLLRDLQLSSQLPEHQSRCLQDAAHEERDALNHKAHHHAQTRCYCVLTVSLAALELTSAFRTSVYAVSFSVYLALATAAGVNAPDIVCLDYTAIPGLSIF
jgi:hypothetical protein